MASNKISGGLELVCGRPTLALSSSLIGSRRLEKRADPSLIGSHHLQVRADLSLIEPRRLEIRAEPNLKGPRCPEKQTGGKECCFPL